MQQRIKIIFALIIVLSIPGCWKQKISGIKPNKFDKGILWHDIYLANNSDKDLNEVKLTFTLIGEDGEPKTENRYFASWTKNQVVKISFEIEKSPINVQKISMTGSCSEGNLGESWIKTELDKLNNISN